MAKGLPATWHAIGVLAILCAASAARGDASSSPIIIYGQEGSSTPRSRVLSSGAWSAAQNLPAMSSGVRHIIAVNCPTRNETACLVLHSPKNINFATFNGSSWSANTSISTSSGNNTDYRHGDMAYEASGDLLMLYAHGTSLRYRTYNGTISSDAQAATTTSKINWIRVVPSASSDSMIVLVLDEGGRLSGMTWNGSAFSSLTSLATGLNATYECFAAAYEAGGDGIIAYFTSGSTLRYRVVASSTIGAQQNAGSFGSATPQWLRLSASPASEQIVAAALDSDKEVHAAAWSGSAWAASASVATGLESNDKRGFDIAWEPDGSHALIAYALSGNSQVKCKLWTGSSWGSVFSGPTGDGVPGWIALTPGLADGTVGLAVFGLDKDLLASEWNGSNISSTLEVSSASISDFDKAEAYSMVFPRESSSSGPAQVTQWRELDRD